MQEKAFASLENPNGSTKFQENKISNFKDANKISLITKTKENCKSDYEMFIPNSEFDYAESGKARIEGC